MSVKCALCGGTFSPDETCEERYNQCLALEFGQPGYGVVHHLTVPCYYLQHNLYSREGWLHARQLLVAFLEEGASPEEVRQRQKQHLDSGQREWHLTKGEKFPGFESIIWTRTIADVRTDTPEVYKRDVEAWAKSVLADIQSVMD